MKFLSSEERKGLKQQHKKERDGRIKDRIKAILLADEGWTYMEIAKVLLISHTTVGEHIKEYLNSKKLKPQSGGSNGKLSDEQENEILKHLEEVTYSKAEDIQFYIKKNYGVEYTLSGITAWLKQQKFSYKSFKGIPAKADSAKQKAFIETYRKLEKELKDNEKIVFLDSVHPTQSTKLGYGWIKTGTSKFIQTTGSRTRLNITGAININSKQINTASYKTINSESTIDFLEQLRRAYPKKKLHLVLDQAGYHRSQAVKDFAQKNNIVLHFLPPYSPNLNPIERLWKLMNEYVRNNRYFSKAKEFREAINLFWTQKIYKLKDIISQRINSNFQRLF